MSNDRVRTVLVPASKPYQVDIGRNILPRCGAEIRSRLPTRIAAVVADETVARLYGETVCRSLQEAGLEAPLFQFAPGEQSKTLTTVGALLSFLVEKGLTRADCVVALGGGIAGDVAGFAAAVYLRGIPVIQLPTTFLAAIDSSVGGKTGVNLPAGKNLAGAFWQPSYVLCDCACFETLPHEVFLDGVAEAVKYGVIADEPLFESLRSGALNGDIEAVAARCVEIKSRFVAEDEFDKGARQLLNFGHTLGHAVEKCSGYAVTHGHAVAVGMVAAARAAQRLGVADGEPLRRIEEILAAFGLPRRTELPLHALAAVMRSDKKTAGGRITLVLPKKIGECVLYPVSVDALESAFAG